MTKADRLTKLIEELRNVLKNRKLKSTVQREIILKAMLERNSHLTPDEILDEANKIAGKHKIGKATVYRALNFFEEEGFVTSISFGSEGKKYEINPLSHHDHMICLECDLIIEFVSQNIEDIQEQIASQNGFTIKHHAMQLYGTCKKCNDKKRT